jgi:hypothetical protein
MESNDTVPEDTAASGVVNSAGIVINEVMAQNKGIFPDETGEYCDWVEIYNPTDEDANLQNYALSDDEKEPAKWGFPDIKLKAGGYLVVFLSGKSTKDLDHNIIHSTIKLSSKGDKLILSNKAGQKLDSIPEYKTMPANVSFGRVGDKWKEFNKPTPGFENTDEGYAAFQKSMVVENSPLWINEVMTSNTITIADNTSAYSDWVEIVNVSDKDVNLKGLGLTDDPADPLQWRFPDITLKPGAVQLVFCSGNPDATDKDPKKGLHASFRLASYKEKVELTNARGMVLDQVDVKSIASDTSYARTYDGDNPSDTWAQTGKPTPGYPNTDAGFADYQKNNKVALTDIIISEVASSNNSIDIEGDKKTYDFIEVENRGKKAVSIKNYGLTTNAKNPAMFRFPDKTLQPGERILVLASGLTAKEAEKKKYLHAPFGLSMEGETLALFNAKDKLIDKYNLGFMQQNISVGREEGKDDFSFFTKPTPGQANGSGAAGFAGDVSFGKASGKYDGSQELKLSAPEGSTIYYTTDGNTPTKSSKTYSAPIQVNKTMVVRARAFRDGYIDGRTMTQTYFINAKHSLPLIEITSDPKYLFDETTGIYMEGPNASQEEGAFKKGANYYGDTEVPATFELYDNDGKRVFTQDIAMKMAGGLGLTRAQKSFAIYARSQYGKSTMQYPFFENRKFTEYKSLSFRTNRDLTKIRENSIFGLVDGKMNVLTQAYKPYVVYINGRYWGVYYLMERRNKYMFAAHENSDNPDALNIQRGTSIWQQGSNQSYKDMIQYAKTHDMSLKENYDHLAALVDTDSFMDVMICNIYFGNSDYYNMQSYQLPKGKWKQVLIDTEITYQLIHDTLAKRMGNTCNSDIFNGLLKYKPWKTKFIERFAWAMKELFNTERVEAAIDEAANAIKDEIGPILTRFGDTASVSNWEKSIKGLHTFAKQRPAVMVKQLKTVFTLSDAQSKMLDDAIK